MLYTEKRKEEERRIALMWSATHGVTGLFDGFGWLPGFVVGEIIWYGWLVGLKRNLRLHWVGVVVIVAVLVVIRPSSTPTPRSPSPPPILLLRRISSVIYVLTIQLRIMRFFFVFTEVIVTHGVETRMLIGEEGDCHGNAWDPTRGKLQTERISALWWNFLDVAFSRQVCTTCSMLCAVGGLFAWLVALLSFIFPHLLAKAGKGGECPAFIFPFVVLGWMVWRAGGGLCPNRTRLESRRRFVLILLPDRPGWWQTRKNLGGAFGVGQ